MEGAEGLESHRQLYLVCYKVCRLCHCECEVMWMWAPQQLLIWGPRPHCCHRPVTCGLGCQAGWFARVMCIAFLAVSGFSVSGLCCSHQWTQIAAPFPLLLSSPSTKCYISPTCRCTGVWNSPASCCF